MKMANMCLMALNLYIQERWFTELTYWCISKLGQENIKDRLEKEEAEAARRKLVKEIKLYHKQSKLKNEEEECKTK